MSHLALRRVMIRLLHDPAFAAALHDDPPRALAGIALDADERGWLLAEPPAAWRTDPARPARVRAALAEEYPATLALDASRAETFFASTVFHAAVQARGSLALAFGDHLAGSDDPRLRVLARLERAIAEVRRAGRPRAAVSSVPERARWTLAPSARVVRVPLGGVALLAAVRAVAPLPPLGSADEPVLVLAPPGGGDVTLEPLAPALAALLERAARGADEAELVAEARRLGADPGEDAEIVAGLVADGLLVAAGC